MSRSESPTVEIEAPNGGRIELRPAVALDRVPGLSRAGLAAVVALGAIFLGTSLHRLNHTDLWAHLSFGRWIVEHGELPSADPFRWDAAAQGFLNVPWLSQVLGYLWHQAFGLEGLVLAHAALVALSAAGVMLAVRRRRVSTGWAVTAGVAAMVLALPILGTIRPQLFGMVGLAVTLAAIARLPDRRDPLFWLPLVFILWANLHGSFAIGLVALACFAVGGTWDARRSTAGPAAPWRDPAVRRAWAALALALAASCINPLGIKLLVGVAGFAGSSNLEGISEWRPMVLESLSGVLFFGSLLATGLLLRSSPRRISACEILLVLAFGLASLVAIRMLLWWALTWPWVVAPHAAASWARYRGIRQGNGERSPADPAAAAKRTCVAAVVIGLTVWWSPATFGLITGRSRPEASVLSVGTPKGVADHIEKLGLSGRIFAPLDWADYLMWRADGRIEPLVYSAVHLTGPDVWRDFLRIRSGAEAWLTVADRYGLSLLLIDRERNGRLAARAVSHPRCRVLYEDRQALLVKIGG